MKELLITLFGTYTPITYETITSDGAILDVIPSGLSGVDWTYILGIGLFALCLYSVFRILGSIISRC